MNKYYKLLLSICYKFSQVRFRQGLFELVRSWESYRKDKKVNLLLRHSVNNIEQFTQNYTISSYTLTQHWSTPVHITQIHYIEYWFTSPPTDKLHLNNI